MRHLGIRRTSLTVLYMLLLPSMAWALNQRAVVLTDIQTRSEPDDAESLVRLLTYSNEIDIKGLVVNNSFYAQNVSSGVGLTDINNIVSAYGSVRSNLLSLDPNYPTVATLQAVVANGQVTYGMAGVGSGRSTAGSNLIIDEVLNNPNDTRPLWVLGWGGVNTLAQALYDVKNNTRSGKNYTTTDLDLLRSRLRVYDIAGQDDAGAAIAKQNPTITYLRSKYQFRAMSYRVDVDNGWSETRGGDETKVSRRWFANNVANYHGALGSQYPAAMYNHEGDSPSFLYLISNGLSDSNHADWGSWGGRFNTTETWNAGNATPADESAYMGYAMSIGATDTWTGKEVLVNNSTQGESSGTTTTQNKTYTDNLYAPLFRFREAMQNDFAARMDWAAGKANANRTPVAVAEGDESKDVVYRDVAAGQTVSLSAAGSYDPDGDTLSYNWWVYQELGGYLFPLTIDNSDQMLAMLQVPAGALDCQIHVILELVDDNGTVPLTSYRREVLTVVSSVPEPTSIIMTLTGIAGLLFWRNKRRLHSREER